MGLNPFALCAPYLSILAIKRRLFASRKVQVICLSESGVTTIKLGTDMGPLGCGPSERSRPPYEVVDPILNFNWTNLVACV